MCHIQYTIRGNAEDTCYHKHLGREGIWFLPSSQLLGPLSPLLLTRLTRASILVQLNRTLIHEAPPSSDKDRGVVQCEPTHSKQHSLFTATVSAFQKRDFGLFSGGEDESGLNSAWSVEVRKASFGGKWRPSEEGRREVWEEALVVSVWAKLANMGGLLQLESYTKFLIQNSVT